MRKVCWPQQTEVNLQAYQNQPSFQENQQEAHTSPETALVPPITSPHIQKSAGLGLL